VSLAVLTPYSRTPAVQQGTRWWKRLLPIGEISYKGRTLKFTKDYLAGLVSAYNDRAYDQVPFQLADAANTHTNDPERTRGQIAEMQLRGDGLWIGMDPTPAGQQVLTANPGLGVSARIVEGYDRSDGKFFPRAIQHVLGTLDPRIPGLGGWQAVEAANDVQLTVDLSGEHFTGEDPGMPDLDQAQQARLAKLLGLDPDKLAALVSQMEPGAGPSAADLDQLNGDGAGSEEEDPELAELLAQIDGMSDDELDALAAELETGDGVPAEAGAGLAADDAMALELAQATGDENARQLAIIAGQLDHERWLNERRALVGGGTPPFIADLAAPLLEGAGHVVDLANGTSVDAGQVVRRILTEYQKLGEQLGIGVELGTEMDEPDAEGEAATARQDVVAAFRAQYLGGQ
jgi:hypothetical protein